MKASSMGLAAVVVALFNFYTVPARAIPALDLPPLVGSAPGLEDANEASLWDDIVHAAFLLATHEGDDPAAPEPATDVTAQPEPPQEGPDDEVAAVGPERGPERQPERKPPVKPAAPAETGGTDVPKSISSLNLSDSAAKTLLIYLETRFDVGADGIVSVVPGINKDGVAVVRITVETKEGLRTYDLSPDQIRDLTKVELPRSAERLEGDVERAPARKPSLERPVSPLVARVAIRFEAENRLIEAILQLARNVEHEVLFLQIDYGARTISLGYFTPEDGNYHRRTWTEKDRKWEKYVAPFFEKALKYGATGKSAARMERSATETTQYKALRDALVKYINEDLTYYGGYARVTVYVDAKHLTVAHELGPDIFPVTFRLDLDKKRWSVPDWESEAESQARDARQLLHDVLKELNRSERAP